MHQAIHPRSVLSVFVTVLLCQGIAALPADGQSAVRLHVASMAELQSDAEKFGRAIEEGSRLESLGGAMNRLFGVGDTSWLDTERPLALEMSVAGFAHGARGVVAVVPIVDGDKAMALFGESFARHSAEDGVHAFGREESDTLFVKPQDGYWILGRNRELVAEVDSASILESGNLPPGTMILELDVAALLPTVQGFIEMRRATAAMKGEASEKNAEESARVERFLDNLSANVARIQLALEVPSEDLVFQVRFLPVLGSTLDTFLAAQSGGLPEISRWLQLPKAGSLGTGQVNITPEILDLAAVALRDFVDFARTAIDRMDDAEERAQALARAAALEILADGGLECFRGDFVSVSTGPLSEQRRSTIAGIGDREACRRLFEQELPIPVEFEMGEEFLMIASGPEARERLRGLAGVVANPPSDSVGDLPDLSPLTIGPGFFSIDHGQLDAYFPELYESPGVEALLSQADQWVVGGLRMEPGSLSMEVAAPLELVGVLRLAAEMEARRERSHGGPTPEDP